jgi:F-type H+-transporting ATPase subunit epsilon
MDVRADRVVVLTEAAEPAEEIDAGRAQEARRQAQEALAAGAVSAADELRARAALQRALIRLRVSESRRRRR